MGSKVSTQLLLKLITVFPHHPVSSTRHDTWTWHLGPTAVLPGPTLLLSHVAESKGGTQIRTSL